MSEQPRTLDQVLAEIEAVLRPYVLHAGECLVERVEDGSDGQRVVIRFAEDRHPLKALMPDNRQTRIIHAIFIETDDTGTPVHQQRAHQLRNAELKGGKHCAQFHIIKAEEEFHRWLYVERGLTDLADYPDHKTRTSAVELVLRTEFLKGRSSKMLDHDPALEAEWTEHYVKPYREWARARQEQQQ